VKADAAGRQTLQGSLTPSAKPVASTRSRATAAPCLQRLAECPGKIVQKSTKPTQLGFTAFPARAPVIKKIGTVRHSPPRSEWPPPKAASASGTCSEKIAAHNEARGNARAHTQSPIKYPFWSKRANTDVYRNISTYTSTHTHTHTLSLYRLVGAHGYRPISTAIACRQAAGTTLQRRRRRKRGTPGCCRPGPADKAP
jgi:hypothetical protein